MVETRLWLDDRKRPKGTILVHALRGGTVSEVSRFLADLNEAYSSIEHFDTVLMAIHYRLRVKRRMAPPEFWLEFFDPFFAISPNQVLESSELAPSSQLELSRVKINSPGFWEVIGQLNPLQQLREYLNDRHERRKDRQYRERAEERRLDLENEELAAKVCKERIEAIAKEASFMREMGFNEDQLRQVVWQRVGKPLAKLGAHQDTKLIGRVLNENELDSDV